MVGGELMIRIHYIEDNLIDQDALAREVKKRGLPYLIDFSSTLAEARAKKEQYDLILCDYYLSDGTILDILTLLIRDATPVIVLTGQVDLNNAITALKLGAKDYLVKDTARQYLSLLPIQINNLIRQEHIERERRWLSTLFFSVSDAIPFGIYLFEPSTDKVVYVSRAMSNLWALSALQKKEGLMTHSLVSQHIRSMITPSLNNIALFPPEDAEPDGWKAEGEVQVQGSKTFRFFTDKIPVDRGMPACYVSIFEDTTELSHARDAAYQYSHELETLNETLDQRVRERTQQIEELIKKKNDLILSMGHDLRTPLTPLVALLPYLRDNETDSEKKHVLSILCEGAIKIRSLVDKTLKMGSLGDDIGEATEFYQPTFCDLHGMADDIIRSYQPAIESKRLQFVNTIPDDMQIYLKPAHLHLILDNLIHNALQFTDSGGSVTLHGRRDRRCSWFCISDTGIGLTQENSSRIFDEFYKVDTSRNNLLSHGLGLSIVKKLVVLNNGHITVKSEGIGQGSRFCVSLPKSGRPGDKARKWDCSF